MSIIFNHHRLAIALYDSQGMRVTTQLIALDNEQRPAACLEPAFHGHHLRLLRKVKDQGGSLEAVRVKPRCLQISQAGGVAVAGSKIPLLSARAIQEAYSDVLGETSAGLRLYTQPHPGFASSVGLHAAVITSEGQLLVPRRSEYWLKEPGLWSATFSTDILPEEFETGTLDSATLRLFAQVLNVEDTSAVLGSVRNIGVLVDMQTYGWYFLAIADFRGLGTEFSSTNLKARRIHSTGGHEFDDCAAIDVSASAFQYLVASKGDLHDIRALAELQLIQNACGA